MRKKTPVLPLAFCLAALLPLAGCLTSKDAEGCKVADNGKALMTLVVAADQTAPERKAVEELAAYLKKITGADFAVQKESELKGGSPALYVGQTEYAKRNGVDFAKLGEEEWLVRSDKGNIVIAGGRPRGTLYGVYHFLEDDLGVRWWTPQAESVPRQPSLALGKLDRGGKPVFAYRDIYLVGGQGAAEFSARNRFSHFMPVYGARIMFGGPIGCHTLYAFLGKSDEVKKLYKEHPEWFPLLDGVRKLDPSCQNGGAQTQLCLSNPELRKFFVERVRGFIKADKERAAKQGLQPPMFYAIDQNDCFDGFCKCDKCMAVVRREDATSGLMLDFTNYVADSLKDETDATFLMMAEHVLERPPQHLKPSPNVGLRLCDTTSNMNYPWTHPDNAKHRANLDGWAKITNKIVMWDYMIHYGGEFAGTNLPFPNERTIAPDLRYLAERHGYGVFFEHEEMLCGDMRDLKIWLEAKLAENPYLDYNALLNDFTDGFYGPAGKQIRQYLALLETAADKSKAKLTYFPGASAHTYLDCAFILPAMKLFDAAEQAVGDDPELLGRVRYARLSLDRACLVKAATLKSEWVKQGNDAKDFPFDPAQILARYQRTWLAACERKFPVGQYDAARAEEGKNNAKFLDGLSKRKALPTPEQFKDVPQAMVYDFNAALFSTYVNYWRQVPDPSTVVGVAWRAKVEDIMNYAKNRPEYGLDHFRASFPWAAWPTTAGTVKGTSATPAQVGVGYKWYKLGSGVKLMKNCELGLFIGVVVALEGVVADNSDVGQEYDLWASVKFDGSGFAPDGRPNKDVSVYIDRVIVIQKTSNKAAVKGR